MINLTTERKDLNLKIGDRVSSEHYNRKYEGTVRAFDSQSNTCPIFVVFDEGAELFTNPLTGNQLEFWLIGSLTKELYVHHVIPYVGQPYRWCNRNDLVFISEEASPFDKIVNQLKKEL